MYTKIIYYCLCLYNIIIIAMIISSQWLLAHQIKNMFVYVLCRVSAIDRPAVALNSCRSWESKIGRETLKVPNRWSVGWHLLVLFSCGGDRHSGSLPMGEVF